MKAGYYPTDYYDYYYLIWKTYSNGLCESTVPYQFHSIMIVCSHSMYR